MVENFARNVSGASSLARVGSSSAGFESPSGGEPYFGHAWQFTRLALHACERAFAHGVYIPPSAVCAGDRYGLSHAVRYQDALGDEPDRLVKLTFREIHRTTPPPAFIDLWLSDLNLHTSTSRKELS
ncbi:MAG: hypothetical protein ACM3U2_23065 [Deltaproteobacteria bacterium]